MRVRTLLADCKRLCKSIRLNDARGAKMIFLSAGGVGCKITTFSFSCFMSL